MMELSLSTPAEERKSEKERGRNGHHNNKVLMTERWPEEVEKLLCII